MNKQDRQRSADAAKVTEAALQILGETWRGEGRPRFTRALNGLPQAYRDILHLLYYEGVTEEEAARIQGMPVDEVPPVRQRALEAFHTQLTKMEWPVSRATVEHLLQCEGEAARHVSEEDREALVGIAERFLAHRSSTPKGKVYPLPADRSTELPPPASGTGGSGPSRQRTAALIYPLASRAVAAVVLAGFLYGMLWFVGEHRASLSETYALASIKPLTERLDAIVMNYRSSAKSNEEPTIDATMEQLIRGIEVLQAAPQTTFGLFPHYDDQEIALAIASLKQAHSELLAMREARRGQPDELEHEPQRALAAFMLAKAYLMQDNVPEASRWLDETLSMPPDVRDYKNEAAALKRQLTPLQR